jgi:hypothetical protein
MSVYKIHILNRDYASWNIFNSSTLEPATLDNFEPLEHRLLNNDAFTYNDGIMKLVHSTTRINENIPAVLILADGKTYGRDPVNGKLLYKCIPDDTRIPIFLVPYEIKQLGFSKVYTNQYVTIRFKEWTTKHPFATINQLIGSVDVLENYYEYQLYCKSLHASIQKFNKATIAAIKQSTNDAHDAFITQICEKYKQIEDRTSWKTFTIDPATSLDFDDAFSIKTLDNGQHLVSIYISNVTIWMDALNLWTSFSQRISTIYLPDRKRPMLPTILSDGLCSLQQTVRRFAFVMDIVVDSDGSIISINNTNCLIKVFRNYGYEEASLLVDSDYKLLFDVAKGLSLKYKYMNHLRNSHDLVGYLMILMNYHCARDLLIYKNGIFRSSIVKKQVTLPDDIPSDVGQFIKIWNSVCGQYISIGDIPEESLEQLVKHELLEVDAYIHITSPIRRLIDLLNMIQFQKNHKMINLTKEADEFYLNWIGQLDYINTTMRAIRKVQHECSLLDTCINDPSVLDKTYDGYCFDKLARNDGLYQFIVYLPSIKLASRITMRDDLENYEKKQYKLFLFNNEEKFKKKIRLHIVSDC